MKKIPKLTSLLLFGLLSFSVFFSAEAQRIDPCQIYGKVYVTKNKAEANVYVYKCEEHGMEDIQIYKEQNSLFATQSGRWHFVDNKVFANYIIFYTDQKYGADFSVFFTEYDFEAGCN